MSSTTGQPAPAGGAVGDSAQRYSATTAAAVVVANMIGTGVFTSLGFQLLDITSGFALLMLWVVGGVAALCGALTYAELGSALPRSGGEYNFLSRIYHPAAGFVSGWVSATIGFAAPVAAAAITFGSYLSAVFPALPVKPLAAALVIVLTLAHSSTRANSAGVQRWFTLLKLALIVIFCVAAFALVDAPQPVNFLPSSEGFDAMLSPAFAVSLIYVSYAYTGWNAATYLSGEIDNPQRSLPRILGLGTFVVLVLYVALNFTFLNVAPMSAMVGEVEVGYIAAGYVFGENGAALMGTVLALLLVSTVSAMTLAGPRVLAVIGQDFRAFSWFARTNATGLPVFAIVFQCVLALLFIFVSSFEEIIRLAGFTLGLNSFVTVLGVFVLRIRQPDLPRPYRTAWFPLPPLVYLAITGWTLVYLALSNATEAAVAAAIIVSGLLFYAVSRRFGHGDAQEGAGAAP